MINIQPGDVFINKKHGTEYTVQMLAWHSENGELMVVYTNPDGEHFVRPFELFVEKFDKKED